MEFKGLTLQALLILEIFLPSLILGLNNCNFPAIFNFGDSNSDTGGLSAAFGQAPPPNGETFFHAPAGRFCDGRLLIDFIAESLGCLISVLFLIQLVQTLAMELILPLLDQRSGRKIRPFPRADIVRCPSMFNMFNTQIFSEDHKLFVSKNLLPEEDYFSRALYIFDIGQNELTAGYKLNLSTEEVKAYVPDVLGQFSNEIKILYTQGGRSFWIHNTGPVGCLPYVMDRFLVTAAQIDKYGCSSPYNDVSQYFNLRLKETVLQLRKELPQAAIAYVDVYSVKYSLISQAKKLGSGDPFLVCCGHGGTGLLNVEARRLSMGQESFLQSLAGIHQFGYVGMEFTSLRQPIGGSLIKLLMVRFQTLLFH